MSKVIVHIDLNAFFVRAEEIKDPTLENKPVAIGHEGRCGIVSTCSYAARQYGVSSGMPMFKATNLCPNLIIKPVDFRFYRTLSHEFFNFVRSYTKIVEQASVDECYADFTDVVKGMNDVEAFFKDFQKKLFEKTKLKCSIGVGPTKFLAKMGSDYHKPMGLTIIRKKDIAKILFPLEIDNMFGIGKRTCPRLKALGVKTIGDLANSIQNNDEKVISVIGTFSSVILDWLQGKGSDEVITESEDQKSIGNSTTLSQDTDSFVIIQETFELLANEVSERAIKDNKLGTTIQIVVKDNDFTVHNKTISFSTPTNNAKDIAKYACSLYEKNFLDKTVRLVGITLQNLVDVKDIAIQMSLFDYEKHEEESQTKLLINELNRKLSKPLLKRASEVNEEK